MNRLLCAASIFALVVPTVAAAQHQDNRQHGGRGAPQAQTRPNGGHQHQGRPGGAARPAVQSAQGHRTVSGSRTTIQTVQRPTAVGSVSRPRSNIRTAPNQGAGPRASNVRRVRAPAFRYPGGYGYRRWNVGLILPSIFLSNYYFYSNWATVGAYPPPPGFVWVRYGPDLLLVSRRNGRIRDVIYGVFY
jgi:Ni/Co efflux regulator RcnB